MKQKLVSEQNVLAAVQKSIAETLRVEINRVAPEKSLIKDLGAESLDFLDMNYRLEQTFGIRTARHFVLEHIEEMFGEGVAVDANGRVTEKGVQLLKLRLGDRQDVQPGAEMEDIPGLVTVDSVANAVMDILDTLPEKCTYCGSPQWTLDDGTHVHCGACGKPAVYSTGDDLVKQWLHRVQQEKKIF